MYTIEIYTDKAGESRWRVRAANGQIVIPVEGYKNEGDMLEMIENLKEDLPYARIVRVDK